MCVCVCVCGGYVLCVCEGRGGYVLCVCVCVWGVGTYYVCEGVGVSLASFRVRQQVRRVEGCMQQDRMPGEVSNVCVCGGGGGGGVLSIMCVASFRVLQQVHRAEGCMLLDGMPGEASIMFLVGGVETGIISCLHVAGFYVRRCKNG